MMWRKICSYLDWEYQDTSKIYPEEETNPFGPNEETDLSGSED